MKTIMLSMLLLAGCSTSPPLPAELERARALPGDCVARADAYAAALRASGYDARVVTYSVSPGLGHAVVEVRAWIDPTFPAVYWRQPRAAAPAPWDDKSVIIYQEPTP